MNEIEAINKATDNHLNEDINWDAYRNEVIIMANKNKNAKDAVEQFASDSFQHGWIAAKAYFKIP